MMLGREISIGRCLGWYFNLSCFFNNVYVCKTIFFNEISNKRGMKFYYVICVNYRF